MFVYIYVLVYVYLYIYIYIYIEREREEGGGCSVWVEELETQKKGGREDRRREGAMLSRM